MFSIEDKLIFSSPFVQTDPSPMADDFNFDRIEGMLLGLAIGDSLGNTTESQLPERRRANHGEIVNYLPNQYANNLSVGVPSDDTQLAFWTLEQLVKDNGLVPDNLATRFCQEQIFGIGKSVKNFLRNYKMDHLSWNQAGDKSAGNGALMRIAPILIPHLKAPTKALWSDTAIASVITHNDIGSISACISFVNILWELLRMESTPDPRWWLDTYVKVARQIEGDTCYSPRNENIPYYGPIWKFTEKYIGKALENHMSTLDACNWWHSGAYLMETIPCVIYILMHFAVDPEMAIIRAVNDTRDNDTIASIVGAAVGAMYGKNAIPQRWIEGLLGRTSSNDDGKVFDLIEKAKNVFWI